MYPASCRYPIDYYEYSISEYQKLLSRFFDLVQEGKDFDVTVQQEYFSSYWPRLNTDIHGYIDWSWELTDIERFICAFDDFYNGASTFLNGQKVRLKKCYTLYRDGKFHPFQRGLIYRVADGKVFVAAGEGTLLVNSILDENGVSIINELRVGDRLYTPTKSLEEAMEFRAVYTPTGIKA
jgi:methionyl-tRNA formyltransferase